VVWRPVVGNRAQGRHCHGPERPARSRTKRRESDAKALRFRTMTNKKWTAVAVAARVAALMVACSDNSNPGPSGPTPVSPDPPTAHMWRGLLLAAEERCSPYDEGEYHYSPGVENRIVAQLGAIFSPYTCNLFESTAETDIEHIVARSEAHDSGLCSADAATRRRFSEDLGNLTLAAPALNRHEKGGNDAAEWMPDENRCWFAQTVVDVRRKYNLTVDQREADALEQVLSSCSSTAISCTLPTKPEPEADHPPVRTFARCSDMHSAGWNRGVNRNGGTYEASWNAAERETYSLNTARDRNGDGHACET